MTEQFIDKRHEIYIEIVKSLLSKIQVKHPGENPSVILESCLQTIGKVLMELGNVATNEAFVVLGFIASKSSAFVCHDFGPNETAKYVKDMSDLFVYTLLERLPDAIDQITQQKKAQRTQNNKVVLPS